MLSASIPGTGTNAGRVCSLRTLLLNGLVGVAYAAAALPHFLIHTSTCYPPGIWPPAGVALAAVLLLGKRVTPGVFIAAWFVHACQLDALKEFDPGPCWIATGAALQALTGRVLVGSFISTTPELLRIRQIALFCLLGMVTGLVGASFGMLGIGDGIPSSFEQHVFATWVIGEGVGTILITPVLLTIFAAGDEWWPHRTTLITGALCLIAFGVFGAQALLASLARQRLTTSFESETDDVTESLLHAADTYVEILHGIRSFYAGSVFIDRKEFHDYTVHAFRRHPGIQALEWVPRVRHEQRNTFEQEASEALDAPYRITEHNEQGSLVPAAERPEYFPVSYVEPLAPNRSVLGYDLYSNASRRGSLVAALETGEAMATPPVSLVQNRSQSKGQLVFLPVFENGKPYETLEQRREHLTGFVLGVFTIPVMMKNALALAERKGLLVRVDDIDALGAAHLVFSPPPQAPPAIRDFHMAIPMPRTSTVEIKGRTWEIHYLPTEHFFQRNAVGLMTWALTGTALLSMVLTAFFLLLAGRTAQITREVREQTDELNHKNEVLNAEISMRKEAQHELEKKNDELQRTHLEMDRINKDLQHFAFTVSHDLKEPVRTINNFAELVAQDYGEKLDDNGREYIHFLTSAAKRMQDLIGGLLSYSRVETRAGVMKQVSLSSVLEDVQDDMRHRIETSGGRISVEGELPDVVADPIQVHQLLLNLIGNALKYHKDDAPPRITISAQELDGRRCRINIRDKGIGIPEAQQDRIFKVFQRLHRDDEYEGIGIGLAICKRIAERHGGELGVESVPGEGSTFWFILRSGKSGFEPLTDRPKPAAGPNPPA